MRKSPGLAGSARMLAQSNLHFTSSAVAYVGSCEAGTMYMQPFNGVATESGIQVVTDFGDPSSKRAVRPTSRCGAHPESPFFGSTFQTQQLGRM